MALWTHLQGTGNDSSGTVTTLASTFTSAVTVGNLLVVGVAEFTSAATITVADSLGNTYTRAVRGTGFNQAETLDIWYSRCTVGGSGNIVTATFGAAEFANIAIDEYDMQGYTASVDNSQQGQEISVSTLTLPVLTVTGTDLVYGLATSTSDNGSTFTAGSGFTARHAHAFTSGTTVGFIAIDKSGVATNTAAVFTKNTGTNIQGTATAFKATPVAGWATVQRAGLQNLAAGTTITATFPGAVTAGNLIVVGVVQWSATGDVLTVSDNKGNAYASAGTRAAFAGTGIAAIYWGIATTGGSSFSVTVSVTSAGSYLTLMIGEFSFGAGSTISVEGYSTGSGTGAPFDSGLITPVTSGDLIIGVMNSSGSLSPLAGSGFTLPTEWTLTSGAGEPGFMEYLLSASGPLNATFGMGGGPTWAIAGAAFKATAPAGAPAGGGASLLMGL